jgi:alpha-mannosidase
VFAQFHDYIPGSSIKKVYDVGIPELTGIAQRGQAEARELLKGNGRAWFNPLAITQTVFDGKMWRELRPLSVTPTEEAKPLAGKAESSANRLKNDSLEVTLDAAGRVTALSAGDVTAAIAAPLNQLVLLTDRPSQYDAWNVDRNALMRGQMIEASGGRAVTVEGKAGVRFDVKFGKSAGTLTYLLRPGSTVVEVELDIDFQEPNAMLKATFPTGYMGTNARYGAPFGSSLRRQLPGPVHGDGQFENPASRWAVVSDDTDDDGLMVVSESKYGFGCRSGLLHVTLLRTVRYTESNHGGGDDFAAYGKEPEIFDLGRRTIRYAFGLTDAGVCRQAQPAAVADWLYTPPLPVSATATAGPIARTTGGESLVAAWVRPAPGGGMLLRLHETLGKRGEMHVQCQAGWKAQVVNMDGSELMQSTATVELDVPFGPYKIVTVRLIRA